MAIPTGRHFHWGPSFASASVLSPKELYSLPCTASRRRQDEGPREAEAGASPGLSRRDFMKISGSASPSRCARPHICLRRRRRGGGSWTRESPVILQINGKKLSAELEPRVTLLDALRDNFNLTGAKRVATAENAAPAPF